MPTEKLLDHAVRFLTNKPCTAFLLFAAFNAGAAYFEGNTMRELNAFIAVACLVFSTLQRDVRDDTRS